MDIKTLQKDMIAAMKARDKARKESISALIQAVKKTAIDAGCRDDIPEEMVTYWEKMQYSDLLSLAYKSKSEKCNLKLTVM